MKSNIECPIISHDNNMKLIYQSLSGGCAAVSLADRGDRVGEQRVPVLPQNADIVNIKPADRYILMRKTLRNYSSTNQKQHI